MGIYSGEEAQEKVEKIYRKKRKRLRSELEGFEPEALFWTSILAQCIGSIAEIPGSWMDKEPDDVTLRRFNNLRAELGIEGLLSTILEVNEAKSSPLDEGKLQTFSGKIIAILSSYTRISNLHLLLRKTPELLEIEEDEIRVPEDSRYAEMEKCFESYWELLQDKFSEFREWNEWFRRKLAQVVVPHIRESLEKEFANRYDLSFENLRLISEFLEVTDNFGKEDHLPTTYPKGIERWPKLKYQFRKDTEKFFEKDLFDSYPPIIGRELLQDMIEDKIGPQEAENWISAMEFTPGDDLYRSPFIPLTLPDGKPVYFTATWVLRRPTSLFYEWVSPVLFNPNSKTGGRFKGLRGYGGLFEKYIDKKLSSSSFKLENLGNRTVQKDEYQKIEPFDIDRIITRKNTCFLISCKARDIEKYCGQKARKKGIPSQLKNSKITF